MLENSIIHDTLREANQPFFSHHSIRLEFLKNCPEMIPTLAQWLYDEWHPYDTSLTKEKLIQAFHGRLNTDKIPITFVALRNVQPIGVISLKRETHPVFDDFPKDSLWMGSLHVLPEERNQGVDRELLKFATTVAKRLGYEKLYFYISNRIHVKWYLKRGAYIIEERPFQNHMITIMCVPLKI